MFISMCCAESICCAKAIIWWRNVYNATLRRRCSWTSSTPIIVTLSPSMVAAHDSHVGESYSITYTLLCNYGMRNIIKGILSLASIAWWLPWWLSMVPASGIWAHDRAEHKQNMTYHCLGWLTALRWVSLNVFQRDIGVIVSSKTKKTTYQNNIFATPNWKEKTKIPRSHSSLR